MNESDPKLMEGLRALAAESAQGASTGLEERLLGEFRRRTRVRRRERWFVVGAGAMAAVLSLFAWLGPHPRRAVPPDVNAQAVAQVESEETAVDTVQVGDTALDFYRLPDADVLPPLESAMVVRIELPMSSLRLMGVPVSGERGAEAVEADVLLGQDGLARGVRFVN